MRSEHPTAVTSEDHAELEETVFMLGRQRQEYIAGNLQQIPVNGERARAKP